MLESALAFLEDADGRRLPVPVDTRRALGTLLTEPALRDFLVAHGLSMEDAAGQVRVRVEDLRQVLGHLDEHLDAAPPEVLGHPLFQEDAPRRLLAPLADVAGEAAIGVVRGPALRAVALVPEPLAPRDALLAMDTVDAASGPAMLAALEAVVDDLPLDAGLVERTLVPLLAVPGLCGPAARVLGRAGVAAALGPLERALSRAATLDDRLAVLGAMMALGHRALGLRTLRSMLVHGSPEARGRAVRTLVEAAEPADADAIHDLLRLAPADERPRLGALLYRLGDMRGYAVLVRAVRDLTPGSPAGRVAAGLDAVESTRSQRFLPEVRAYADRETRPWFRTRARRLADALARHGQREVAPQRLVEMAEQAYFANRRDQASEHLREVLALDPNHAHALYLKANCLKEEGRVDEALRTVGQALASEPGNWRVHRLRGSLLWDSGQPDDALEAYDRALVLQPTDPYTWYYKGYVLYRLQRYPEALPCLDRALSLKTDSPYIYNQKAFCLERLGRHAEAVQCYRRSLRLAPGDLFTREYLGQALQAAGRLDEALACFEAVLRLAPGREDALYRRADVLYDLERWAESAEAFDLYLARVPDSYNAWFNRGLCLRFLGRLDEAARSFERALELRPDSANARRHLAFCRSR